MLKNQLATWMRARIDPLLTGWQILVMNQVTIDCGSTWREVSLRRKIVPWQAGLLRCIILGQIQHWIRELETVCAILTVSILYLIHSSICSLIWLREACIKDKLTHWGQFWVICQSLDVTNDNMSANQTLKQWMVELHTLLAIIGIMTLVQSIAEGNPCQKKPVAALSLTFMILQDAGRIHLGYEIELYKFSCLSVFKCVFHCWSARYMTVFNFYICHFSEPCRLWTILWFSLHCTKLITCIHLSSRLLEAEVIMTFDQRCRRRPDEPLLHLCHPQRHCHLCEVRILSFLLPIQTWIQLDPTHIKAYSRKNSKSFNWYRNWKVCRLVYVLKFYFNLICWVF